MSGSYSVDVGGLKFLCCRPKGGGGGGGGGDADSSDEDSEKAAKRKQVDGKRHVTILFRVHLTSSLRPTTSVQIFGGELVSL